MLDLGLKPRRRFRIRSRSAGRGGAVGGDDLREHGHLLFGGPV